MDITLRDAYSFHARGHRNNQEDSRYPDSDSADVSVTRCFAVCDGVGGQAKGEVASSTVAQALGKAVDTGGLNERQFGMEELTAALCMAYDALDRAADTSNNGMATTMTLLVFSQAGALAAYIGDSRIYQIRPGHGIMYRSEDHSLVNALVRSGNLSPEEAENHPRRNVITRCMSAVADHNRDNATAALLTDIRPGDVFILASDGVTHCVRDDELCRIACDDIPDREKRDILARMSADSPDNNTLWIVTVADVGNPPGHLYPPLAAEVSASSHHPEIYYQNSGGDVCTRQAARPTLIQRITSLFRKK